MSDLGPILGDKSSTPWPINFVLTKTTVVVKSDTSVPAVLLEVNEQEQRGSCRLVNVSPHHKFSSYAQVADYYPHIRFGSDGSDDDDGEIAPRILKEVPEISNEQVQPPKM
jgi:hypothetical protein